MMIHLIPVNQPGALEQAVKSIYHDSFPPDERRAWDELMELTRQLHFNLYSINNSNGSVGFISIWKWPEFSFIEHFAIGRTYQSKGIGSEVLSQLLEKSSTQIILETEEPHTEPAIRRIAFYTRLGFQLCHEDYYQPAYSSDKNAVKMFLMSYPEEISPTGFTAIKTKLFKEVYHRNVKGFS